MTREEVRERYQIPLHILQEYEQWEPRHGEPYEETDVKQMSMMMTLHSIGFSDEHVQTYLRLTQENHTEKQRLAMLDARRRAALQEIHIIEKQIDQVDYLRYTIQKECFL